MTNQTKNIKLTNFKKWCIGFVSFIVLQIIFIICEQYSWSPYRDFKEGTLIGNILKWPLFTEWFAPYSMPESNVVTAILAFTLLITAVAGGIKIIFTRE